MTFRSVYRHHGRRCSTTCAGMTRASLERQLVHRIASNRIKEEVWGGSRDVVEHVRVSSPSHDYGRGPNHSRTANCTGALP